MPILILFIVFIKSFTEFMIDVGIKLYILILIIFMDNLYFIGSGSVIIDGREYLFSNTKEAIDTGITDMTVEENLFIGHIPKHLYVMRI